MAKLSDLVFAVSEVAGAPLVTVRETGRRLREAGLIHTGKGGRYGGADMTPNDAASLLTGLMILGASGVSFSNIAEQTKLYLTSLKGHNHLMHLSSWSSRLALPELHRLRKGHTFGDAFSALLVSSLNGDLDRAIAEWERGEQAGRDYPYVGAFINVFRPRPAPEATIGFEGTSVGWVRMMYLRPRDAKILVDKPRKWSQISRARLEESFDLVVSALLNIGTIKTIGQLLRNPKTEDS